MEEKTEVEILKEQNKELRWMIEKCIEECRYTAPEILHWKLDQKVFQYYDGWKAANPEVSGD